MKLYLVENDNYSKNRLVGLSSWIRNGVNTTKYYHNNLQLTRIGGNDALSISGDTTRVIGRRMAGSQYWLGYVSVIICYNNYYNPQAMREINKTLMSRHNIS